MNSKHYPRILHNSIALSQISEYSSSDEESVDDIENWSSNEENAVRLPSKNSNNSQQSGRKPYPPPIVRIKRNHSPIDSSPKIRRILGIRNNEPEITPSKTSPARKITNASTQLSPTRRSCGLKWQALRSTLSELKMHKRHNSTQTFTIDTMSTAVEPNRAVIGVENTQRIEYSTSSSDSESDSPKHATTTPINTQLSTAPTELDLLVALIEREYNTPKTDVRGRCLKRYREGGFVEQLRLGLARAHTAHAFLKHDQQLKLHQAQLVCVLGLYECFGVHFAQVQHEQPLEAIDMENPKRFYVIVETNLAKRLQVGSKLQAFFDEATYPYRLEVRDGKENREDAVFVAPQMLSLIE